jgi:sortase (surface protein transpeptidase)
MRLPATVSVVVAALITCGGMDSVRTPPARAAVPVRTASAAEAPRVVIRSGAVPTGIAIPSIGVRATSMTVVGVDHGVMQVPSLDHPEQIAWYRDSPAPGDLGPSIVISHRDGHGRFGGFARLDALAVGALVVVTRSDGQTATFRVSRSELVPKKAMEAHVPEIYGRVNDAELRLITCSGPLDTATHNYTAQRLVLARLVSLER